VSIGFWASEPPDPDEFTRWDPDREPERYASGVGHNVLELAKRLEALGAPVAVGRDELPKGIPIVFLLKDAFGSRIGMRRALRAIRRARGWFAVIRSDTPIDWHFPVRPTTEFVPTKAVATRGWQRWLPPLPQRGLRPRKPERFGRVRTLVFKGNPENVPQVVLADEWRSMLADRDIRWWIDAPGRTDGSDQSWHDFSEVDAVLCAPHPGGVDVAACKPATRLINAWVAGSIPLAVREPAYVELGRDGDDVLFFDDLRECAQLLVELRSVPLLERLERGVAQRAAEFSLERTSRRWLDALQDLERSSHRGVPLGRVLTIHEKRLSHLLHEGSGAIRDRRAR
jgi:hypothetical protein